MTLFGLSKITWVHDESVPLRFTMVTLIGILCGQSFIQYAAAHNRCRLLRTPRACKRSYLAALRSQFGLPWLRRSWVAGYCGRSAPKSESWTRDFTDRRRVVRHHSGFVGPFSCELPRSIRIRTGPAVGAESPTRSGMGNRCQGMVFADERNKVTATPTGWTFSFRWLPSSTSQWR